MVSPFKPIKEKEDKVMNVGLEDERKQAFELFVRALTAAPDSFIKSLSGKEYAKHVVEGAQEIEGYLFPKAQEK